MGGIHVWSEGGCSLEQGQIPRRSKRSGISAQGETITAIDKEGNSLRNFIVWLDSRAEEEAAVLDSEFGSDVCYRTTGQVKMVPVRGPPPKFCGSKITSHSYSRG